MPAGQHAALVRTLWCNMFSPRISLSTLIFHAVRQKSISNRRSTDTGGSIIRWLSLWLRKERFGGYLAEKEAHILAPRGLVVNYSSDISGGFLMLEMHSFHHERSAGWLLRAVGRALIFRLGTPPGIVRKLMTKAAGFVIGLFNPGC